MKIIHLSGCWAAEFPKGSRQNSEKGYKCVIQLKEELAELFVLIIFEAKKQSKKWEIYTIYAICQ